MEQFKKLSRAEMKNVRGGEAIPPKCGQACDDTGGSPSGCPSSCNCGIVMSGSSQGSQTCGANN
jgi:hypothetical protein